MKRAYFNDGFTLMELIISIAFMGIISIALLSAIQFATLTLINSGQYSDSVFLRQADLELAIIGAQDHNASGPDSMVVAWQWNGSGSGADAPSYNAGGEIVTVNPSSRYLEENFEVFLPQVVDIDY